MLFVVVVIMSLIAQMVALIIAYIIVYIIAQLSETHWTGRPRTWRSEVSQTNVLLADMHDS